MAAAPLAFINTLRRTDDLAPTGAKRKTFKTRWYNKHPRFWFKKARPRPAGHRERLEVVRLDPEPGVEPSPKPPVRIFLGTEPLQARAERVFVWSVKQHRDPARAYEIHLMKDLRGFDRSSWTTGFTNYRFAIPTLAGNTGRGIYNDVDQIYLADPSEMFDLDMKGKGILCIDREDTSVSLLDCEIMSKHWLIEEARTSLKRKHFLDIIASRDLWGPLPPEWNARDAEYSADRSKCFHFTTLRTQPWRPFPDQLRYEEHPQGEVWFALERGADAARFNAFTRERPGSRFAEALARGGNGAPSVAGDERRHAAAVGKLIAATGAKSVLDYSAPPLSGGQRTFAGVAVTARNSAEAPFARPVEGRFDGVVSIDALSGMPEEDAPWALDELFAAAAGFVYVAVVADPARTYGGAEPLPPEWWRLQMELAAKRTPGRLWSLAALDRPGGRAQTYSGEAPAARAA